MKMHLQILVYFSICETSKCFLTIELYVPRTDLRYRTIQRITLHGGDGISKCSSTRIWGFLSHKKESSNVGTFLSCD